MAQDPTWLGPAPYQLTPPTLAVILDHIEALAEGFDKESPYLGKLDHYRQNPRELYELIIGPPPETYTQPDGEVTKRVPGTTFWLHDGKNFIGSVNIRHHLSKHLEKRGGHIGYQLRQKHWGKGLATHMLASVLPWCRTELGLEKVLLTCDDSNAASARVMEKNGGQLQDIIPYPYDPQKKTKRYWIPCP